MKSIRALHVAADEAHQHWLAALRDHTMSQVTRTVFLARLNEANEELNQATTELNAARHDYDLMPVVSSYDRLIAAALACHATDQEATDERA